MIKEFDIDDLYTTLLMNTLNDFFNDLEEILTVDILNEDDIIKLIQNGIYNENENSDSEKEQILVSLSNILKSLQIWITFFKQQQMDKFYIENINIFNKYFKIIR